MQKYIFSVGKQKKINIYYGYGNEEDLCWLLDMQINKMRLGDKIWLQTGVMFDSFCYFCMMNVERLTMSDERLTMRDESLEMRDWMNGLRIKD